ncbi:hypothetical protein BGW80DRAFT_1250292 [Lactifluus volemus]|nr:hypothetical protein BGW80DRAFT_1250292 [Lactifluus volemus]
MYMQGWAAEGKRTQKRGGGGKAARAEAEVMTLRAQRLKQWKRPDHLTLLYVSPHGRYGLSTTVEDEWDHVDEDRLAREGRDMEMEMEMDVKGRVLAGRHGWTVLEACISSEVYAGRWTQSDESGQIETQPSQKRQRRPGQNYSPATQHTIVGHSFVSQRAFFENKYIDLSEEFKLEGNPRLVAGTWYLSYFVRHPWDQLRPTDYSHPPFLRSHPCISLNMSSRKDHSVGYDHTLSSSVPDPTRTEKQVGYNVGLEDGRDGRAPGLPEGARAPAVGGTTLEYLGPTVGIDELSRAPYGPAIAAQKVQPWYGRKWGIIGIVVVALLVIGGAVGGAVGATHHSSHSFSVQDVGSNGTIPNGNSSSTNGTANGSIGSGPSSSSTIGVAQGTVGLTATATATIPRPITTPRLHGGTGIGIRVGIALTPV